MIVRIYTGDDGRTHFDYASFERTAAKGRGDDLAVRSR
jgi:hypothetical protein